MGMTLAFFQSSGTSSNHHDLSKITESSLTRMSTSSLSTDGCNPSGPMDLCPVCLDVPYPDPPLPRLSLPYARLSLWSQGPEIPEGWSDHKKALSTSAFLLSEFSQDLLAHPYRSPAIFAPFPDCWDGPVLSLEEVILEYQPSSLGPLLSPGL